MPTLKLHTWIIGQVKIAKTTFGADSLRLHSSKGSNTTSLNQKNVQFSAHLISSTLEQKKGFACPVQKINISENRAFHTTMRGHA